MEEIGNLLPTILRRTVRRAEPILIDILAPLWPRITGKPIAQSCRPIDFSNGTLILSTNCPSWAAELRRIAEEIRAGVNGFLGEPVIKKITVRYEPDAGGSGGADPCDNRGSNVESNFELDRASSDRTHARQGGRSGNKHDVKGANGWL